MTDTALAPLTTLSLSQNPAAQKAAKDYESVILSDFTRIMMETIPEDELGGGGHAMGIYKQMLSQALGDSMTKQGGIGISASVMGEMIRMQSGTSR